MAFAKRKFALFGKRVSDGRFFAPEAPGAVRLRHNPGEVPDRSMVPEEDELPVPPPDERTRRPLTEYGTAQQIMEVYDKNGLDPTDPNRFVQAPPSYEEQRKQFAGALKTPLRPQPGYALTAGSRLPSEQLAALSAEAQANQPFDPTE